MISDVFRKRETTKTYTEARTTFNKEIGRILQKDVAQLLDDLEYNAKKAQIITSGREMIEKIEKILIKPELHDSDKDDILNLIIEWLKNFFFEEDYYRHKLAHIKTAELLKLKQ